MRLTNLYYYFDDDDDDDDDNVLPLTSTSCNMHCDRRSA